MTRNRWLALVGLLIGVGAIAALVLARRGGGEASDENAATATITVAEVKSERLDDVTTAFGLVQADPGATSTLAAPRPLIVERLFVRPGAIVRAGDPLAEVVNAPASTLAYRQAADAARSAQTDLARVQRLYGERLVASDQLAAAQKALADANAALAAQQQQGAQRAHDVLAAKAAAVVVSVAAAPGDRLAQDAPLMVLARQGALSAKLGVEPSAPGLAAGDAVTIRPTAGGAPIITKLTMVAHIADPATRTLDALATLPGAAPPIGTAVTAEIVTGWRQGLAAPRGAVVFDETGAHVFVISGDKARRVFVTAGRNHGDEIEISGPIRAGDLVAVQGAYELQDGMAVKVASR